MLDKPELDEARLKACLQETYGLNTAQLDFLPLGADPNTAVYKAVTSAGQAYFVKLRRGVFDELSVRLPHYLSEHGVSHLIPVIRANSGKLWARLEPDTVVLYPFVEGKDGYKVPLTERQWLEFGVALKRLHTLSVPTDLLARLRRETYDAGARKQVRAFLLQLERIDVADSIAGRLVTSIRENQAQVADLIDRAERYAEILKASNPEIVVCHSDLHAGNVFIDEQSFYLVDWDDPILAPKERDLMYVGGAQGFIGHTPDEEVRLFYSGYGRVNIDPIALAYYRLERIVQDVAIYCDELTRNVGSEAEREQSLAYLTANFRPGGTLERGPTP